MRAAAPVRDRSISPKNGTIAIGWLFVAAVEKVADTVIAAQRENPQFFPFPVTRATSSSGDCSAA